MWHNFLTVHSFFTVNCAPVGRCKNNSLNGTVSWDLIQLANRHILLFNILAGTSFKKQNWIIHTLRDWSRLIKIKNFHPDEKYTEHFSSGRKIHWQLFILKKKTLTTFHLEEKYTDNFSYLRKIHWQLFILVKYTLTTFHTEEKYTDNFSYWRKIHWQLFILKKCINNSHSHFRVNDFSELINKSLADSSDHYDSLLTHYLQQQKIGFPEKYLLRNLANNLTIRKCENGKTQGGTKFRIFVNIKYCEIPVSRSTRGELFQGRNVRRLA